MAAPDPIKEAVDAERIRLRESAESKKRERELEIEFLDDTPSRVKVDARKELIIEPSPLLASVLTYVLSPEHFDNIGMLVGLGVVSYMVVPRVVSNLGRPIIESLLTNGSLLFVLARWGRSYVVDTVKGISELNEPFHLKVSGKNFMVHGGNPEEYVAASTKADSDGKWNIMAEIDEVKGSLSFTWAYGPDINNLTTGSREFTRHLELSQPYLNLSDIDLIRGFLNENGIEITTDRRINE